MALTACWWRKNGLYATNNEGETAAYSFVQGKHALLCYVNPRPSLMSPSAGYVFGWRGISQGMGVNMAMKRFAWSTWSPIG